MCGVQPYKYGGKELDRQAGLDWYDSQARMYDPLLGRTPTMDPKAEDYYAINPYAWCAANPIMFVDSTGLNIYRFNAKGLFLDMIKNSEFDAVEIVRQEGDTIQSAHYNNGTISHRNVKIDKNSSYEVIEVKGDDNGKELFEFFAENVSKDEKIEYSLAQTGAAGKKAKNFITTSHERGQESGMSYLFAYQLKYGYTIRNIGHTHPELEDFDNADKEFIKWVNSEYQETHSVVPSHFVYDIKSKNYLKFRK